MKLKKGVCDKIYQIKVSYRKFKKKVSYKIQRKYVVIRTFPIKYSIRLLISISAGLFIFCLFFFWGRTFGWYGDGFVIDNAVWGNLGDFVGGMLGPFLTFITILFMWWSIRDQQNQLRKTTRLQNSIQKRQEEMARIERFNALFFSMLDLYNSRVNELKVSLPIPGYSYSDASFTTELAFENYSGKEFFSALMRRIKEKFNTHEQYHISKQAAIRAFASIYNKYSIELSVYFRTVYRIFDFIYHAEIPEEEKVKYVKIMRAQLTRGELFFLHYNACSRVGNPMAEYVVMFRLTKHLPIFDRLEFKWLISRFKKDPQEKVEGLNIALYQITEKILDIIQERIHLTNNSYYINDSTRYKIQIIHSNPSVISLVLKIYRMRHNMLKELSGFVDFKEEEFKWLLKNYLKCIFKDTSFNLLNPKIRISTPRKVTSLLAFDNYTAYTVSAWNPDGQALRVTHKYWN